MLRQHAVYTVVEAVALPAVGGDGGCAALAMELLGELAAVPWSDVTLVLQMGAQEAMATMALQHCVLDEGAVWAVADCLVRHPYEAPRRPC